MSVPQKYRAIGDFHEYYSGKRTAPYLTLFVGGNHEASAHLHELYYGGWVAPRIYYLGAANVIRFGDLRIAGLSGIWKGYNYQKPHFERVPYTADEVKSLYHVREIDVRKLLLLREQADVGISHDWPRGIEWQGDYKTLFRKKDLFEADAKAGTLGSSAAKYVMHRLRPSYWFAAHLHCKYAAVVDYTKQLPDQAAISEQALKNRDAQRGVQNEDEIDVDLNGDDPRGDKPADQSGPVKNEDEIDLDVDEDPADESATPAMTSPDKATTGNTAQNTSSISADLRALLPASFTRPRSSPAPNHYHQAPALAPAPPPPTITNKSTSFLALDKCLPNRKFLQLIDITPLSPSSTSSAPTLTYDPQWLSILRVFRDHDPHKPFPPNLGESAYLPLIASERSWVDDNIVAKGKLAVPENFSITAPVYDGMDIKSVGREQPKEYTNPQTQQFCELLEVKNWFHESEEVREERRARKEAIVQGERDSEGDGRGRGGGRGRGRGRGGRGHGGGRGGRGPGRGWR